MTMRFSSVESARRSTTSSPGRGMAAAAARAALAGGRGPPRKGVAATATLAGRAVGAAVATTGQIGPPDRDASVDTIPHGLTERGIAQGRLIPHRLRPVHLLPTPRKSTRIVRRLPTPSGSVSRPDGSCSVARAFRCMTCRKSSAASTVSERHVALWPPCLRAGTTSGRRTRRSADVAAGVPRRCPRVGCPRVSALLPGTASNRVSTPRRSPCPRPRPGRQPRYRQ